MAVALLSLLLFGAAPAPGYYTYSSMAQPPTRYQGVASAVTIYANDIDALCGAAREGYIKLGCVRYTVEGVPLAIIPNPCNPAFKGELFAAIACHEKGHILGWEGHHPL